MYEYNDMTQKEKQLLLADLRGKENHDKWSKDNFVE